MQDLVEAAAEMAGLVEIVEQGVELRLVAGAPAGEDVVAVAAVAAVEGVVVRLSGQ